MFYLKSNKINLKIKNKKLNNNKILFLKNIYSIHIYGIETFISYLFKINYDFSYENYRYKRLIDSTINLFFNEKDISKKIECPICLDFKKTTKIIFTNCNHNFCIDCTKKMIHNIKPYKKFSCAICRQNITKVHVHSYDIYHYFQIKFKKDHNLIYF